jgi:hypothetical protein
MLGCEGYICIRSGWSEREKFSSQRSTRFARLLARSPRLVTSVHASSDQAAYTTAATLAVEKNQCDGKMPREFHLKLKIYGLLTLYDATHIRGRGHPDISTGSAGAVTGVRQSWVMCGNLSSCGPGLTLSGQKHVQRAVRPKCQLQLAIFCDEGRSVDAVKQSRV